MFTYVSVFKSSNYIFTDFLHQRKIAQRSIALLLIHNVYNFCTLCQAVLDPQISSPQGIEPETLVLAVNGLDHFTTEA